MERCSNVFPGGASNFGGEGDTVENFEEQFAEFLQSNIDVGHVAGDAEYSPSIGASGSAVACVDTETHREPFSGFDFQNMLRHSSLQRTTTLPDFPWETSGWKAIFDDNHDALAMLNPLNMFTDPAIPAPLGGADEVVEKLVTEKKRVAPLDRKVPIYTIAVGHRHDSSWEEKREADMQRSLMKWAGIVSSWGPDVSSFNMSAGEMQPTEVCEQLGHYFAGKAPATLIKRANSMIFVMEFAFKLGYMFPYSEPELYSLFKTLKAAGNTCSRMKGIMEALTFCRYVFDIDELHKSISSKRCHGVISAGPLGKANQAEPLTVANLERLHAILEGTGGAWDKLASGAFLFCVYSRARWSDFIHGGQVKLDRFSDGRISYVEMDIAIHKTMHAAARRFRFLNLTAPGVGVHGSDWVGAWMQCMVTLNIDPHSANGSCLMPAPGDDGRPLKRAVESDEAGCWLRLLLGEAVKRCDSVRKLSSHSLKSTMLSFAAKRGYSLPDRLSMGHHAHPFKMADVYARDAQARDLRLLDSLIAEIRAKRFLPDESRAGRMVSAKKQKGDKVLSDGDGDDSFSLVDERVLDVETKGATELSDGGELSQGESDGGSHVTTDSSESDSDEDREEERLLVPRVFLPPKPPDGCFFVRHVRSKMLHYMRHDNRVVLVCGRQKTASYEEALNLRYDSAVCHACQVSISKG